jgi:hypothetical protein
MAMIIFTAMIVKAKTTITTIMAMTIKPYESIAYTEIAPRTHYSLTQSIQTVPDTQSVVTKHDRLASKTIRNMHGCLRALLNQGKAWELVRATPAQGVRLPRKKSRKPPVVLAKQDIFGTRQKYPSNGCLE